MSVRDFILECTENDPRFLRQPHPPCCNVALPIADAEYAELLKQYAESGDRDTWSYYAICCLFGIGMEQNLEEAAEWAARAVSAGVCEAERILEYATGGYDPRQLAELYREASDEMKEMLFVELADSCAYFEIDARIRPEYEKYIKSAADSGHAIALYHVGMLYAMGADNTPKDRAKALECFERAVASGFTYASPAAGAAHILGFGTACDEYKAADYFREAYAKGYTTSGVILMAMHLGNPEGAVGREEFEPMLNEHFSTHGKEYGKMELQAAVSLIDPATDPDVLREALRRDMAGCLGKGWDGDAIEMRFSAIAEGYWCYHYSEGLDGNLQITDPVLKAMVDEAVSRAPNSKIFGVIP